ncbi:MAG: hypothetical protein R3345_00320 [Fulvivirga sp.]|nr:hypothetical protein [Fulvivirga sp.]
MKISTDTTREINNNRGTVSAPNKKMKNLEEKDLNLYRDLYGDRE